jgi:GT2 family glycosyltransferase
MSPSRGRAGERSEGKLAEGPRSVSAQSLPVSVIIITLDRPECVQRCLRALADQTVPPHEVVVVDASSGPSTKAIVASFPGVRYVHNPAGAGRMTSSRNVGLEHVTGEVIAFLDDDSFAEPSWLAELSAVYDSPDVGGVGGRALVAGAAPNHGAHRIGELTADGYVIGAFDADPGSARDVDHLIGCNMSFRRTVIEQLGGFREDFSGVSGIREDTDICLRVTSLGYRLVFAPRAVVDHVGAKQVVGNRFDVRYDFFTQRNHVALLLRNFGMKSTIVRRYGRAAVREERNSLRVRAREGRLLPGLARSVAKLAGVFTGVLLGVRGRLRHGADPVKRDAQGQRIRAALQHTDAD